MNNNKTHILKQSRKGAGEPLITQRPKACDNPNLGSPPPLWGSLSCVISPSRLCFHLHSRTHSPRESWAGSGRGPIVCKSTVGGKPSMEKNAVYLGTEWRSKWQNILASVGFMYCTSEEVRDPHSSYGWFHLSKADCTLESLGKIFFKISGCGLIICIFIFVYLFF